MTHRAQQRRPSRATALAEGLAALLATLAAILLPPLLLGALIGNPLPHHVPTGQVITGWLRSPLSDRDVLDIIAVATWAAWLHFLACLAAELTRQVRGASWHVPAAGTSQHLVQYLVTAVLLLGQTAAVGGGLSAAGALTPAASAAPVPGRVAVSAAAATRTADTPAGLALVHSADQRIVNANHVVHDTHRAGNGTPIYKEYVVKPPRGGRHDNLWDIAARHLGDPMRWKEIFALNDGRAMTNGQRMEQSSKIQPGWVLRMPADAHGLSADAAPGDSVHNDKHTSKPHVTDRHDDDHPSSSPHHLVQPPAPRRARAPLVAPPPTPASSPSETATATPRMPAAAATPPAETVRPGLVAVSPPPASASHHRQEAEVAAGLSVAAIGVLEVLRRRRRVAARRRKPGTRVALPTPKLAVVESRLRRDARDATVVVGAVRLAMTLAARRDPAVTVSTVWHHPDGIVELAVDVTRTPPEPFTASPRGWQLDPGNQAYLFAVGDQADPAPVMAPVGTAGGAVCYVNLEVPGLVSVAGPDVDTDALISGIVAAVAGAPWSQELVRAVVPPRLAAAATGQEHVEVAEPLSDQLDHTAAYVQRAAADVEDGQPLSRRRRTDADDATQVVVLAGFSATELPSDLLDAATSPAAPLVVILTSPDPRAQEWTVAGGILTIPGLGELTQPTGKSARQTASTVALLEQALDATPATPERSGEAEITASTPPDPTEHRFEVRLLGPVDVTGIERLERRSVLAVLLFLALHRRPLTNRQISASLWPDREYNADVVRTRVGDARRLLDQGVEKIGQSWLLADHVGSDWQRFQALAAGDSHDQLSALRLVRGLPFDGYDGDWIHLEGYRASIEAAIVDLALSVAEHALAASDPTTAKVAAAAGLRACPYDERLYRLAMQAATELGATSEVKALRRQLDRVLDDDIEPEDHIERETVEAYENATRGPRRRETG